MKFEDIKRKKEELEGELLGKENVIGVSIGNKIIKGEDTGELCIVVLVERKLPESLLKSEDIIPKEFGGLRTDVQEVGRIKALGVVERRGRWRPCIGGISIGHKDVTAGTLGCFVIRERDTFILSNNHVLANENNAQEDDAILQPGPYDGGVIKDKVAELVEWVTINFNTGDNYVDAAIATPINKDKYVNPKIYELKGPEGTVEPKLGMMVVKSGRTSGVTKGTITQIGATVKVDYKSGTAIFKEQVICTPLLSPGDSGSIILVEGEGYACGLGFAGSGRVSLVNPIERLFKDLRIDGFKRPQAKGQ